MEFMPQRDELPSSSRTSAPQMVVEEEVAAAVEMASQSVNAPLEAATAAPPPEKPIYFSDGVMYPSELNCQPSTASEEPNEDQTVALPDNLLEIYDNLGLIGKLLTGGSLVTIKFLQAFRTLGESLVDILGITKPKYEYEINLAKQMQEQEAQRQQKLDQLYSSWQSSATGQMPPPGPSSFIPYSTPMNTALNMEGASVQYPAVPGPAGAPTIPPPMQPLSVPSPAAVQVPFPMIPGDHTSLGYPPPPPQSSIPLPPVPSGPPPTELPPPQ